MSKLAYRPDIDGLRTIAVLPVVLFHVGFSAVSGGFVGVDVFFAISGYLITRLVLKEIDAGTFTFGRFYERRVRRLFPAMLVTSAMCLVLSPMLLSTRGIQEAMASVIFAVTSLSNLYFYSVSGYFDADSLAKPLLHTWSLSVEEQYYLVWPALLLVSFRFAGLRGAAIMTCGLGLASLAAAEWMLPRDASAAFYLMPFRIVEFVIGAGVLVVERFVIGRNWLAELCLATGLFFIGYSAIAYNETMPFPGVSALLPAAGAALALVGGQAQWLGVILRNPPTRYVGQISYSIYLIHWPVIVFFDAYFFRSPELLEQVAMVATTLLLSAAMYHWVETPYRNPRGDRRLSAAAFGLACALLAITLIVPAAYVWGTSDRFGEDV